MGKCGLTGVVPDHGVLSLACEPPVAKTVFVSIVCSYSIFERLSISREITNPSLSVVKVGKVDKKL